MTSSRKKYQIKEMFLSKQGEGYFTGRMAVFCRFTGCNLWSGQNDDKMSAQCSVCDTDFIGTDGENGGTWDREQLVNIASKLWPGDAKSPKTIILTGGEPMLQVTMDLIDGLHEKGWFVCIETNGTIKVPGSIDWIAVSPKSSAGLKQISGNELKLLYPIENLKPSDFESYSFDHYYLQPVFDTNYATNLMASKEYISANPLWRLSLQMHKIMDWK